MARNAQEDSPRQTPDPSGAQKRAWTRPALVEYGHLAKLTRGTSGTVVEQGMLKMACL